MKENKLNMCSPDSVYSRGFGIVFEKHLTDPSLSFNEKYVLAVYGMWASPDGARICRAGQDCVEHLAGMRTADFYSARKKLGEKHLISVRETSAEYKAIPGRFCRSHTEVNVLAPGRQYGLLPRKILLDENLSKKDRVCAAYLYALIGRIEEYRLSGFAMRKNLCSNGRPMSDYAFRRMLKVLSGYFAFRRLKDAELLEAGISPGRDGFFSDYYMVKILECKNAVVKDTGNCAKGNMEPGSKETGCEETGSEYKRPLDSETFLSGKREVCFKDSSHLTSQRQKNELQKENPSASECPEDIKKRLGADTAKAEIETLYVYRKTITEEERDRYFALTDRIAESLYSTAVRYSSLEEYALARNYAAVLLRRIIYSKIAVRNIDSYIKASVVAASKGQDRFVYHAPAVSVSSSFAYVDGYRISDGGESVLPLTIDEMPEAEIDFKKSSGEITGMLSEFHALPYRGFLDDPLMGKTLCRMLCEEMSQEERSRIREEYGDEAEAVDIFSRAFMSLLTTHSTLTVDGNRMDPQLLLKKLSFCAKAENGQLLTENSLAAKAVSLYLFAEKDREILNSVGWMRTTIIRELLYYEKGQHNGCVENPIPAFRRCAA